MHNNKNEVISLCPEIENFKIPFFYLIYPSHKNMERNKFVFVLIFRCIFPKNLSVGSCFPMFLIAGFYCITVHFSPSEVFRTLAVHNLCFFL